MVSSELYLAEEDDDLASNMKEMIGGCCVCSDERGWAENPLVYCDGHGCNVAVHQACYGIVQVPTGPWFCRKCESQERAARVIKGWRGRKPSWQTPEGGGLSTTCNKEEEDSRLSRSLKTLNVVRCELCPHKDGALKRTDNGGWAHVVCALYIPEVEFANVSTMEPIVLQSVPHERYNKTCYICEEQGRESKAASGACMTCNKHGCRQAFHVTCAQLAGLLCEEQGSDADNVKYCGYCKYHYSKLRRSKGRGSRAQSLSDSSTHSLDKHHDKEKKKHKERDRHKPKHKKPLEISPSLVPALMVTSEKSYNSSSGGSVSSSQKRLDDSGGRFTNANFQEVPSHSSSSSKDGGSSDGKSSEGKIKKSSSHSTSSSSGSRGRKSTMGKPHGPVVTTATSSTAPSSSSPFQQVSYPSSSDVACPLPSVVLGGSLSGSNSEFPAHQSVVTSMPNLTSLPPTAPFTSTSSTHSNSLPGNFNLAPSHMFGNRLNPNSAMAALIAQSESCPADQELGDGALGFSRRGNSPKANLSPRSPLSGLHIQYDSSGPLVPGLGSGTDTLPPVATSIDQLLERQWNEGQQFLLQQGSQGDVLGMLKSLHQLQVENRRLEEHIRTLTMKKERLQLLSAQLSVPFTPTSTPATTASSPMYPSNTHTDMLHSKSNQLGSSVLTESSQPLPTQDPLSGGHSSGSSTSSLSTPPSAAHSPPQQQVNGVGMAGVPIQPGNANSCLPGFAGVTGLMGALHGNHLAMSGIVGTLNGVIQTSPSLAQNSSPLPHPSAVTSSSLPMSNSLNSSAARLLTEQHRQILLHQHQLQQLFNSQHPTLERLNLKSKKNKQEQQQVLLYQLMQQQQQQQNDIQLQQLPINSLLPSNQPAISTNPFLAMHNDNSAPKTGRLGEKAVSVTGHEKT
ncbi:protein AF-10-like isoform X12 [Myxocyprinus asiaticus]|uniref:protein AF-10-like isoform X12 n=1 Tax=Myxocyprinus asiaticus TaxID=70543 RepID=UPI0022215537|nr:protein AF-10-like isoform X12 [Myxocyprinus asiaticus]